jgi:hypothetical protein
MATNTSKVFIDIITEFTGTKSVKQAESSFNKLAKSIGRVVSVAAIEEFSRRSIKAFLADDAAAKQLEKTLTNLGVYFDSGVLSKYIQELQDTTGVLDDQLRPAFQSLAVATGDYTKAQDLLNTALDVSQATGKSLSSVSTALSRAYLGNFTAVSRLGAGISKAEIAAGDFNAIQEKLNKNFGGSALAAADTYAGQLRILKAAFTDVQETIGKGFVDAFTALIGPDGSATQFAQSLKNASLYIADIIRGLGIVAAKLKPIDEFFQRFTGSSAVQNIPVLGSWLVFLNEIGKKQRELSASFMGASPEPAQIGYAKLAQDKKALAIAKKLAAEEKKKADAAKKAANAASDKLKTEKENAILNAAAKVLDVEQAQILAALGKNITQDERNRLLLQQALLNNNSEAAGKLAQTILASQQAALLAQKADPFGGWNDSLQIILNNLKLLARELALLGAPLVKPILPIVPLVVPKITETGYIDDIFKRNKVTGKYGDTVGNLLSLPDYNPADDFMRRNQSTGQYRDNAFQNAVINVMLDANTLTGAVTSGQQNTTASGIVVGTSRINKIGG